MGLMVDRICAVGRSSGQMTVEFVAALPVLLAVAAISVNALAFFGWCAAFDDDFRDSVRVYAASPAYGQGVGDTCAFIERALDERLDAENVSVSVSAHGVSAGHTSFSATLEYMPTLFGLGLKSEVMGVALPKLSHTEELVVDCYKPGVRRRSGAKTVGARGARRLCAGAACPCGAHRCRGDRASCRCRRRASPGGMADGVRVGFLCRLRCGHGEGR